MESIHVLWLSISTVGFSKQNVQILRYVKQTIDFSHKYTLHALSHVRLITPDLIIWSIDSNVSRRNFLLGIPKQWATRFFYGHVLTQFAFENFLDTSFLAYQCLIVSNLSWHAVKLWNSLRVVINDLMSN